MVNTYQGEINTDSEQEWGDIHPHFGNQYYYPVLPKYDKFGRFIKNELPFDRSPFPIDGIITNNDIPDVTLKFIIEQEEVESNILYDKSGNGNYGFVFSDYKPKFDLETGDIGEISQTYKIRKSKINGAF